MRAHFTENMPDNLVKYELERKETVGLDEVIDLGLKSHVRARYYMARSSQASTIYVNLWVWTRDRTYGAWGSAGGWGYDKSSAALQDAITRAGFILTGDPYDGRVTSDKRISIAGVGSGASQSALTALARLVSGKRTFRIVGF